MRNFYDNKYIYTTQAIDFMIGRSLITYLANIEWVKNLM